METREQELSRLKAEQQQDDWSWGVWPPDHWPQMPRRPSAEAGDEEDDDDNEDGLQHAVDILGQRLGSGWAKALDWDRRTDVQVGRAIKWREAWNRQPDEVYLREVWARVRGEAARELFMGLYGRSPLDGHRRDKLTLFARWLDKYRNHPELTAEGRDRVVRDSIVFVGQLVRKSQPDYEIIQRRQGGESERKLAAEYGTSRRFIRPLCSDPRPGEEEVSGMITQAQATEMLRELRSHTELLRRIDKNTEQRSTLRDLEIFAAGAQAQSEIEHDDVEDVD
jgi:hypothetical protein